uniref:Reverse transcriptase domain-containing protein n=1 Tax=Neogobius melanostomus TaxID=47308 RepID=A0A8C6U0A8_9GOBI
MDITIEEIIKAIHGLRPGRSPGEDGYSGTKQGCPLSPLTFAIALEPLAIAIRGNSQIQGIWAGQEEHKIFLYADDLLLVTSNPTTTIPLITSLIDNFSKISGYRINWAKSEVMPISGISLNMSTTQWPFKRTPNNMIYLGIKLTRNIDEMMHLNLEPIIQSIKLLLSNWEKFFISIIGRINLIKMIIIPKINYLLYIVESFVWQGKKPLVGRVKLYSAKEQGGLSLPNLEWYHCSFSLAQLSKSCYCWLCYFLSVILFYFFNSISPFIFIFKPFFFLYILLYMYLSTLLLLLLFIYYIFSVSCLYTIVVVVLYLSI